MADPWFEAVQERRSQTKQGITNAFSRKGGCVRDQLTRDGATATLIAARSVELPILPNFGEQGRIALYREGANRHLAHPLLRWPLRLGHYEFLGDSSGVNKKLPVLLHHPDLKVFAPICFRLAKSLITDVEEPTIPHELLSFADHGEIRAQTKPPHCPRRSKTRDARHLSELRPGVRTRDVVVQSAVRTLCSYGSI